MGASFSMARAMERRCRSPPERCPPPPPTRVSKPFSSPRMKSQQPLSRAARSTSASVAEGRPMRMFSRTVVSKRKLSWET